MTGRVRSAWIDFATIVAAQIGFLVFILISTRHEHFGRLESVVILLAPITIVAILEAGFRCSLGKLICGFRVYSVRDEIAAPWRLMARSGLKYSFMFIPFGMPLIASTEEMAGTLFCIAGFLSIIVLITLMFLLLDGLTKRGDAYYDYWLGLKVVSIAETPEPRGFPISSSSGENE